MLDLESVRLFVLTAEFGSLTRAAEIAGTVQPVVSQRLKALEARLGRRLLDRTPRFVRLTAEGAQFLEHARALLTAHDRAIGPETEPAARFSIGLSDHAVGIHQQAVFRRIKLALPTGTLIEVRTGLSQTLHAAYDLGELDAILIRRESGGSDGEVLGTDPLGWRATDDICLSPRQPIPMATLGPLCGVRASATRALDAAGLPWREAFVGGGCAALLAAAQAGLGVAPMGRLASGGVADIGPSNGLPALDPSEIVLFGRATSPMGGQAIRALAAGVRAALLATA